MTSPDDATSRDCECYEAAFAQPELLRCAVNQAHARFDARVGPDDEVAFFPPVTGG